jgi:hypothetical protein
MKYVITILLAMGITPTFCQAAPVDPGWNFEITGFDGGGGTLSGMFYGTPYNNTDKNFIDLGNLSSFMATWTGNDLVGSQTYEKADLFNSSDPLFIYNLSTGAFEWRAEPVGGGPIALMVNGGQTFVGGIDKITVSSQSPVITPKVPVPAAVWLFGSGLIGLIGVARRKKA